MNNLKLVLAVAAGVVVGFVAAWALIPAATDDADSGQTAAMENGAGSRCSSRLFNCVLIELEMVDRRFRVDVPRSANGDVAEDTQNTAPVEVDPASDDYAELAFHWANPDESTSGAAANGDCHYWVEHNGTWYKLHC